MALPTSAQFRPRRITTQSAPSIHLVAQPCPTARPPICRTDRIWDLCDQIRQWLASGPAAMQDTPIYRAYLDLVGQVERVLAEATTAPLHVTVDEAAQFVPLTPTQLRHLCRTGQIPGLRKEGGRWWIPTAWIASIAPMVSEVSHAA